VGVPGLADPQRFTIEQPQRGGTGGLVVLHCARLRAHEVVAGAALLGSDLGGVARLQQADNEQRNRAADHSTVIAAVMLSAKLLSPVHLNSSVPDSVATVV